MAARVTWACPSSSTMHAILELAARLDFNYRICDGMAYDSLSFRWKTEVSLVSQSYFQRDDRKSSSIKPQEQIRAVQVVIDRNS